MQSRIPDPPTTSTSLPGLPELADVLDALAGSDESSMELAVVGDKLRMILEQLKERVTEAASHDLTVIQAHLTQTLMPRGGLQPVLGCCAAVLRESRGDGPAIVSEVLDRILAGRLLALPSALGGAEAEQRRGDNSGPSERSLAMANKGGPRPCTLSPPHIAAEPPAEAGP